MDRKAAIYARISKLSGKERNKEGAGLGVTRQQEDCESLATQLGWEVAGVYVDDDTSAYSRKPRPQYDRMLADLRDGCVTAVVCWHTDRLHRSPEELETYIDVCEPRGVVTQTVKAGHLDLTTPSGRMVARQLGVIARYEVEHMAERQQAKKAQHASQGQWLGGKRPFGFDEDGMTIRPVEAAEIVQASHDALAGVSLHAIARGLNGRGVATSQGARWRPTSVRRMLLRPRNAGIMVHKGREVGAASWPPLVSENVFRALQHLLTDPERRNSPADNSRRYLGSGIFWCGVCDDGTTVRTASSGGYGNKGSHRPAYRCRVGRHLVRNAANVDTHVEGMIVERLSRSDATELLGDEPDVDTAALQAEAEALRQRLTEISEWWGSLKLSTQEYQTAKSRAEARLDEIDDQMARAATADPLASLVEAEDVQAAWDALTLMQQRTVVSGLVTVTVYPSNHRGRMPDGGYFDPSTVTVAFQR